ncbi:MAG: hypothetical protein J5704_03895 [Paludibacteraceae bacterium]|nr:hypothetical protein [Paludibacteraceae bacterium]
MKINVDTLKQQTQDFVLRLFVEAGSPTTLPSEQHYLSARCGTFARLHH